GTQTAKGAGGDAGLYCTGNSLFPGKGVEPGFRYLCPGADVIHLADGKNAGRGEQLDEGEGILGGRGCCACRPSDAGSAAFHAGNRCQAASVGCRAGPLCQSGAAAASREKKPAGAWHPVQRRHNADQCGGSVSSCPSGLEFYQFYAAGTSAGAFSAALCPADS